MPSPHSRIAPFPPGFIWGAATSAFQIEGASDVHGRGRSIWDAFSDTPGNIANGDDGKMACDHYNRWHTDLDLAKQLALKAYRFSVAWPRIQPDPGGSINQQGLDFYDRLVDDVLERGMAPCMTLYHWDLPQYLQDRGGWKSRETVDRFVDYARVVARRLGDRVAGIATFNEPFITAFLGHWLGTFAPGIKHSQAAMNAGHHQLLAHGQVLRTLRADGVQSPLGIFCIMGPVTPHTSSDADQRTADRRETLLNRFYLGSLLQGRYPDRMFELLEVVPDIEDGDLDVISTPMDFLGVNYYYRHRVSAELPEVPLPPGAQATAVG